MAESAQQGTPNLPFDPSAFYGHVTLEELVQDHEPIKSMDQFLIEDLTDEEWEAFQKALEE